MVRLVFLSTSWLLVALPLSVLTGLFFSLSAVAVLSLSAVLALPYGGLMWFSLQRPIPAIRKILMQGISIGYACAGGLLLSWPLALSSLSGMRGLVALSIAIGLLALGVYLAVSPRVRTLRFESSALDKPTRLVQLSDIHLGSRAVSTLASALKTARAQQPDMILITGDLVDGGEIGADELTPLSRAGPPIFMVTGNHERYVQLDVLLRDIRAQGVRILHNASVDIHNVKLIGVDDSDAANYLCDVLPQTPTDSSRYNVLLYHKPDNWAAAREAGVDLMLSGHTHAGQVWPFSVLVKRRHAHWRGLYSADRQHLYVSPGTGCWGPVYRIGSRAEITVIDLLPAPHTAPPDRPGQSTP